MIRMRHSMRAMKTLKLMSPRLPRMRMRMRGWGFFVGVLIAMFDEILIKRWF